jgi:hypothetical protein
MATTRRLARTPSGTIAYVDQGSRPAAVFARRAPEWPSVAPPARGFADLRPHWLAPMIPGTKRRMEIAGGRIFFPEERAADFRLRAFWSERS